MYNLYNMIMKKKRISVLEWESMVNTISITEQEKEYAAIMAEDSLRTMEDTAKQMEEEFAIRAKHERAYYSRK